MRKTICPRQGMKTAASSWKRIWALVFGLLLTGVVHIKGFIVREIYIRDLPKLAKELRNDNSIEELILTGCQLDTFPLGFGGMLPPNLKVLTIDQSARAQLDPPPVDDERWADFLACESVRTLKIRGSFGSPAAFMWIKRLLPNITELITGVAALPIQINSDIETARGRDLSMENVLVLGLRSYHAEVCPIYLNLELFRCLKEVCFFTSPGALFEDTRGANLKIDSVTEVTYLPDEDSGDLRVLGMLSKVFPKVETLSIHSNSLKQLTSADSDVPIVPYKAMTTLMVSLRGGPGMIYFGDRTNELFPFLSWIVVSDADGKISFSTGENVKLDKVDTLSILGLKLECLPGLLYRTFPKLKSLRAESCELKKLVDDSDETQHEQWLYHPTLEALNISGNPGLNSIIAKMKPYHLSARVKAGTKINPSLKLSNLAYIKLDELDGLDQDCAEFITKRGLIVPVGGIYAPRLKELRMVGSFHDRLPSYFLQACPMLKMLKLTVDPNPTCTEARFWDFLRPLTSLKCLIVEINVQGSSDDIAIYFLIALEELLIKTRDKFKLHVGIILSLGPDNPKAIIRAPEQSVPEQQQGGNE